ncbi:hypothetical protein VTO42DRAFT_5618 [Malbranchea cinnamomea]
MQRHLQHNNHAVSDGHPRHLRAQARVRSSQEVRPAVASPAPAVTAREGERARKKAKSLPESNERMSDHSAGQDIQFPPAQPLTSVEGTPPRLEKLNLQDGSIAPPIGTSDVGPSSPVTPNARKRMFTDQTVNTRSSPPLPDPAAKRGVFYRPLPPNNLFHPDLEDGGHRIYSNTKHYSIYDFNSPVTSMARMQAPNARGAPVQQQQPLSPRSTESTTESPAQQSYQMLRQPETRPISEEQLINEVCGIYAGLVMVEKKCVEIDQQQASRKTELSNEQWQALIALHRTLLHEHHDFFLASQHPSSTPALQKLASKYAMPARMWRYGIHSFLELLRHRLPEALEHMLTFIYTAYSMMTLLVESVPSFEDTWIECLGDLARYRMAIEEADLRDREVWAGVARYWYNKAAYKNPRVGRIQHHLAVLARPNVLQQLFYYTKSLTCVQPFPNTRDSILLLFNPILQLGPGQEYSSHLPVMTFFVKAHGTLFSQKPIPSFIQAANEFTSLLVVHISRVGSKFREQGAYLASINFAAMLEYGNEKGILMPLFDSLQEPLTSNKIQAVKKHWASAPFPSSSLAKSKLSEENGTEHFETFRYATYFACHVLSLTLRHIGNKNVLPHVHVSLVFLWNLILTPHAMALVEMEVPWQKLVTFLNGLNQQVLNGSRLESEEFPMSDGTICHLPEDYLIHGQIWSSFYHPDGFFDSPSLDEDERSLELPRMAAPRAERCIWLGHRIASMNRWIWFDKQENQFQVMKHSLELEKLCDHQKVFAPVTRKRPEVGKEQDLMIMDRDEVTAV